MFSGARTIGLAAVLAIAACGGGGGGGGSGSGGGGSGGDQHSLGLKAVNPEDKDHFERRLGFGAIPQQNDWTAFLPPIGDQGAQGSCVGWATAYYVKSAWEARSEQWSAATADHQFSPAFVYNQINGGQDQGSQPSDALELMVTKGAATLSTMSYTDADFLKQPSANALAEASGFKNTDWREYNTFDPDGLVNYLATTGPIVFGIEVRESFMRLDGVADYPAATGPVEGLHAIACVGYDLDRNGGSFLLANSWGTDWAAGGFVYVPTPVMEQIFFGAWTMVDGPNTGTDSEHGAPAEFTAQAWNEVVELAWSALPWAQAYRLERRETSGTFPTFQRIADFPADQFFHQDLDVAPGTTYVYRIAGVDATGASGLFAEATVSTSNDDGGGSLTLTASDPDHGASYPDRIALDWTKLPQSAYYGVFRSDDDSGFRTGNYDFVSFEQDTVHHDDYVEPGSVFEYLVLAFDPMTLQTLAQSNADQGATSGSDGGADIGVLDAMGDTYVTRGAWADAEIYVANYTDTPSPNQAIVMGMEYYMIDGSWGVLHYADAVDGSVPVFAAATETTLASYDVAGWLLQPIVPVYLVPDFDTAWHFWYFRTDPLTASGELVSDVFPWDNELFTADLVVVQ